LIPRSQIPSWRLRQADGGIPACGSGRSLCDAHCRIRGCLPKEQEGPPHFGYFIAAAVLDVDIEIAIGNAAHGVAEKT
jgi:hypothetical protein